MSRLWTRGRRYCLLTTVLTVLLMGTLAVPASAHPGHGGRHTDQPRVLNEFFGPIPPDNFECRWRHGPSGQNSNHYRCTGSNFNEPLSTEGGQGLLRVGSTEPDDYQVTNPSRFSCSRVAVSVPAVPRDWSCGYRHEHEHLSGWFNHSFRLDEMVVMEDPDVVPDPHGRPQILYAWPPHK
jgi:hypothetical protein